MALQFLARSTGFLACLSLVMPAAAAAAAATVPQPEPEVKPSDTDALTIFRHGADAHGILAANWSRGDACTGRWTGVGCPADGRRVTSLMLSSLDLRGPLDPLSHLAELRALDLRGATPEHPHPLSDAADAQRRDKRSSAAAAAAASLPEWVRSVVREEWTAEVFDVELLRYRDIEEEMVAMLHVALACVAPQPEQRPSMGDVVRMIESVPVDQSPMPEEDRDVSPSIGVTTDDGGGRRSY